MRIAPEAILIVVMSTLLELFPGGCRSLSAQERASWMLTVDERIARRLDPQSMELRLADQWRRSGGSTGSRSAGRFVIDGKKNPELFLPWELMDSLLGTAAAEEELGRTTYRPGIALFGWDYDAFWQHLASQGRPFASAMEKNIALQRQLIADGLPRTGQDLAALNLVICQARADVLAASRTLYGATEFDKFLYVAVAPTLATASERPIDAATLRWLERGCR